MLTVCSILLLCALLTLPQGAQGYRPVLIIRQKASEKDFLSHVLHGQSPPDEQLAGDPGGQLPGELIEVEALENFAIAIGRGDPSLVPEVCKTPLGYMAIKVLKASSLPLENEILTLVTRALDTTLPQILPKILCPVIHAVVSSLEGTSLSTARRATSPPGGNSLSAAFKISLNPDAVVLELTGRSLLEQILPLFPENTTENAALPPVPQG